MAAIPNLAPHQRGVVDSFKGMLASIRHRPHAGEKGTHSRRDRSTIGLFGGRGFGKTTVLHATLAEVAAESPRSTVVLDPICPESFLVGDHPIGWAAGLLRGEVDTVVADLAKAEKADDAQQLQDVFNRFNNRTQWYLLSTMGSWAGAIAPEQVADTLGTVAHAGATLTQHLQELVDVLLQSVAKLPREGPGEEPLLIISFDDADLHPSRVAEVLDAIPLFASLDRVAVVVAGDLALFRNHLREDCERRVFHLPARMSRASQPRQEDSADGGSGTVEARMAAGSASAQRLAEDRLAKYFPCDLRLSLDEYPTHQRLDFRPDPRQPSLRELFSQIRLRGGNVGPTALVDLFDATWHFAPEKLTPGAPTSYAAVLPGDPRSLVALHGLTARHVSSLLAAWPARPDVAGRAQYGKMFFAFLRELIPFFAQCHEQGLDLLAQVYRLDHTANEVIIDAAGVESGVTVRHRNAFGDHEVLLLRWYFARFRGQRLSDGCAALFRLAAEVVTFPCEQSANERPKMPGGPNDQFKPVHLRDSVIGWPVPQFDSYLIQEAWQMRWARVYEIFQKAGDDEPDAVWLFYAYCHCVANTARVGATLPMPCNVFKDTGGIWEELAACLTERLRELAAPPEPDDTLYELLRVDIKSWILVTLALLSDPAVALHPEVAGRAALLRVLIAKLDGHGLSDEEWRMGQASGVLQAKTLTAEMPQVQLADVDWRELMNGLFDGKTQAIRTARYLIAFGQGDDERKAQLINVMQRLNIDFRLPEAASKSVIAEQKSEGRIAGN